MALILSILLMPIFIFIICLFVASNQTPIFFVQRRIGRNGNAFDIIKFRTLITIVNPDQSITKIRFPLGDWLRKTSLDEIPQLWNIIKQDMSFIGPRPLLPEYQSLYSDQQRKRHLMKPGITGWAQVNGRNRLPWSQRFELDLEYISKVSFVMDVKILLLTVFKYFQQKDVVPEFDQPFTGNQ